MYRTVGCSIQVLYQYQPCFVFGTASQQAIHLSHSVSSSKRVTTSQRPTALIAASASVVYQLILFIWKEFRYSRSVSSSIRDLKLKKSGPTLHNVCVSFGPPYPSHSLVPAVPAVGLPIRSCRMGACWTTLAGCPARSKRRHKLRAGIAVFVGSVNVVQLPFDNLHVTYCERYALLGYS